MIRYYLCCNGTRKAYHDIAETLFLAKLLHDAGHNPVIFPVIDGQNAYQEWRNAMIRLELLEQDPA